PTGVYTIIYTIVDKLNPTNISTTSVEVNVVNNKIVANDDAGSVNGITGGTLPTVLDNDTFSGNPVNVTDVDLSEVSSTHPNITLDLLTGEVEIKPNTPAGTYSLVYKITDKLDPANNDEAIVVITVADI